MFLLKPFRLKDYTITKEISYNNLIDHKHEWKVICNMAGNLTSSKTVNVEDLSNYTEMLVTCGVAVVNQTTRILNSIIIPITTWNGSNDSYSNGYFQCAYSGTTYCVGISKISNTSLKLYANTKSCIYVYVR